MPQIRNSHYLGLVYIGASRTAAFNDEATHEVQVAIDALCRQRDLAEKNASSDLKGTEAPESL